MSLAFVLRPRATPTTKTESGICTRGGKIMVTNSRRQYYYTLTF